ncbi:MAG: carboxypeptidase regulatory-like domain-containing protein, partial [Candidatus Latescibacterota bacterium]
VARKLSRPALAGVILAGGCSLAVAFSLPLGEAGKQTVASSPSGNPGGMGEPVQVAQAAKPSPGRPVSTLNRGVLAGTVTDESGKPLEGVLVDVWTWMPGNDTHTDRQGRFRLEGLPVEEKVQVQFSKEGYSPHMIPIQEPGVTNLAVKLGSRTYFEGRVFTPDGKAVPGALIRADRGMQWLFSGIISHLWIETKSGSDGRYRLYAEPDTLDIQVTVPGTGVARIQNQPIGENESKMLDIPLREGVAFRARVVDSVTGKPVPGVKLKNWNYPWIEGISKADGRIIIGEMLPGPFDFDIEVKGYTRWWSEDAAKGYQRYEVPKASRFQRNFDYLTFNLQPEMSEVTITAEPAVTITGKVVDPDGKPVTGATVAPTLSGDGNSLTGDTRFSVETQGDGTFEMYLPASGEAKYNIMAHDGKYGEWRTWANGVMNPIQTRPGQTISGVTIALTRPATVSGVVVNDNGKPLVNYRVHSSAIERTENRYYYPVAVTDEQGKFTLRLIRPGKNLIMGSKYSFPPGQEPKGSVAEVDLKAGEERKGINLVGFENLEKLNSRGR